MRVCRLRLHSILVLCAALSTVAAGCGPPEVEDASEPGVEWEETRAKLAALGYLEAYPIAREDEDKIGVESQSGADRLGLQLLTEKHQIRLIDMDGEVVREATADDLAANFFSEAEYSSDGTLLVVDTDAAVLWLDRDWKVLRRVRIPAHHDITSDEDQIYVVTRRLEHVEQNGETLPLLVDYLTVLSMTGEIVRELSVHDVAGEFLSEKALQRVRQRVKESGDPVLLGETEQKGPDGRSAFADTPFDVFHTNYVHVVARDIPGVCRRGDLLVSIRNLDRIAFIRLAESRIVWSWGPGELEAQHNPVLLANGNILIFDNGNGGRGWSRALEMDPKTKTQVWEYHADPRPSFFSHCCGSVQELPNGNVVITDAEKGRVFEVTRDKRIVWDYWNSFKVPEKQKRVSTLRGVWNYLKAYISPPQRERVSILRSHRVTREQALPAG